MRLARELLILCLLGVVLISGILYLTDFIDNLNKDSTFYSTLSAISTSVASLGGLLLLIITFLYLLETKKMTVEARRQRELLEEPAVSIKVIPERKDPNFLFIVVKNTGGGPAYDISIKFIPDISYRGSTLNELNMFKNMPLLDKGEEVSFFFDSAVNFFKSDKPMHINAKMVYYKTPSLNKDSKKFSRDITINFEERKGQLHLIRKDIHDLVNEVEELKHALLISLIENRGEKND